MTWSHCVLYLFFCHMVFVVFSWVTALLEVFWDRFDAHKFMPMIILEHVSVEVWFLGRTTVTTSDSDYCCTFLCSVVCMLIICLSQSCTLLKSFDRFWCHLACPFICGVQRHIISVWGLGWGRGNFVTNTQPKRAVASSLQKKWSMIQQMVASIS